MSDPIVRPYGDATGDGMVQLSFTLPLPHDKRAEGAALQARPQVINESSVCGAVGARTLAAGVDS